MTRTRWPTDLDRSYSDPLRSPWGERLADGFATFARRESFNPAIEGFDTVGYTVDAARWWRVGDWARVEIFLDDDGTSVVTNADLRFGIPAALGRVVDAVGYARFYKTSGDGSAAAVFYGPDGNLQLDFADQADSPAINADGDSFALVADLKLAPTVTPNPTGPSRPGVARRLWEPPSYDTVGTGTASSPPTVDIGLPNRNRVVVVMTSVADGTGDEDVSAVTVDGNSATLVARAQRTGVTCEMWYVDDDGLGDSAGPVAVAVSGPTTPGDVGVWAAVAAGLDQSGPADSGTDTAAGSVSASVDAAGLGMAFQIAAGTGISDERPEFPLVVKDETDSAASLETRVAVGFEPIDDAAKGYDFATSTVGATVAATWDPAPPPVEFYQEIANVTAPAGGWTVDDSTDFVSQNGTYRTVGGRREWARLSQSWGLFRFEIEGAVASASTHDIEIDLPPGWVLDADGEVVLGLGYVSAPTSGRNGPTIVGVGDDANLSRLRVKLFVEDQGALNAVNGSDWSLGSSTFRARTGILLVPLWTPLAETWHSLYWVDGPKALGLQPVTNTTMGVLPDELGGEVPAVEGTNPPIYKANVGAIAGRSALFYDGSNDQLTAVFDTPPDYTNGVTFVVIGSFDDVSTAQVILHTGENPPINSIELTSAGKYRLYANGTAQDSTEDATTGVHLFLAYYDGSTGSDKLKVDGDLLIDANAGSSQIQQLRLGNNEAGNLALDGKTSLVGVYEGNLIGTAIESRLEDLIQSMYGGTLVSGGSGGGASPPTTPEPDDDTFAALFSTSRLWIPGNPPEVNDTYCYEGGPANPTNPAENLDRLRWWVDIATRTGSDDVFRYQVLTGRPRLVDALIAVDGVDRPGIRFDRSDLLHLDSPETVDGDAADWTVVAIVQRGTTANDQGIWRFATDYALSIAGGRVGVFRSGVGEVVGAALVDTDVHVVIITNASSGSGTVSLYLDRYSTADDTATTKFDLGGTSQLGRGFDADGDAIASGVFHLFPIGYEPTALGSSDRQIAAEFARDTYGVTLA